MILLFDFESIFNLHGVKLDDVVISKKADQLNMCGINNENWYNLMVLFKPLESILQSLKFGQRLWEAKSTTWQEPFSFGQFYSE